MNWFKRASLLFILLGFSALFLNGQNLLNHIEWEVLPDLPAAPGSEIQHGLASPFSGISNDVLLVAGGCNFPEKPVWEGGQKKYYYDAFALERLQDGTFKWHSGFHLI